MAPRDRVIVRLRTKQGSRDLDQLSTGQRATAILLLIFAVNGKPVLLDQPEDDLYNSFIYEDVVAIIRQQKALTPDGHDRQIIAATHNPNIPMLGDAELVAVLDATNTGMVVTSHGSIDDLTIRTTSARSSMAAKKHSCDASTNTAACDPNCQHYAEPNKHRHNIAAISPRTERMTKRVGTELSGREAAKPANRRSDADCIRGIAQPSGATPTGSPLVPPVRPPPSSPFTARRAAAEGGVWAIRSATRVTGWPLEEAVFRR